MVNRYPFRDPNRMRPDDSTGNRRERDDMAGNRIDRPRDRERDDMAGNRIDRPRDRDDMAGNRIDRPRDQQQQPARRQRDRQQGDDSGGITFAAQAAPLDMTALTAGVEALVKLVTDSGIDELQVENGPFKLTIRCGGNRQPVAEQYIAAAPAVIAQAPAQIEPQLLPASVPVAGPPAQRAPLPETHVAPSPAQLGPGEHMITSPMVGTFYAGPSPKDPPFVTENDPVEPAQTIGIIEAMKMMNPIEAEMRGRVARILVRDGQPVEYGQPLMVIAEA